MSRFENQESSSTQQLKEKASETASQVKDAAQEQLENLRSTASEYYQHGKEKALKWEAGLEDYVREQPVKSLLIAAGIGVCLGVLWRRI